MHRTGKNDNRHKRTEGISSQIFTTATEEEKITNIKEIFQISWRSY